VNVEFDKLLVQRIRSHRARVLARNVFSVAGQPVAWSAGGNRLAVGYNANERGGALVFDLRRGTRRNVRFSDGDYDGSSFSPDGSSLAVVNVLSRSSTLQAIRVRGGHLRTFGSGSSVAWGSGGIASVDEQNVFVQADLNSERHLLSHREYPLLQLLNWSRDGRRLLVSEQTYNGSKARALLLNPATGEADELGTLFSTVTALSRDGEHVLVTKAGDVVSVDRAGALDVLARHARAPSWSK
jgi:Tol biopolymer transport system component